MTKKIDIDELKELGLQSIKSFWGINDKLVESMNKDQLYVLIQKAKLGMQFYRETNIQGRSIENNTLRIFTMIAKDKDELKKLLNANLPQYTVSK